MRDCRTYFAPELEALRELQDQGLVRVDDSGVQRSAATGRFFVRAVAMVLDRDLQADRNRARFSKII
jgi:oxygen-independent coproporphyrinogen-3 oxidase